MITNYERMELLNAKRHREVKAAKDGRKKKRKKHPGKHSKPKVKPVYKKKPSTIPLYSPGMLGVDFYQTREWMGLRYATLLRYGPICQCCGATRETGATIQVDHIQPRSKYPLLELDPENLQVLCRSCNLGKLATTKDWR